MTISLSNSNQYSGTTFQKSDCHNTLINPSHPQGGKGFLFNTQEIQSCPDPDTIKDCFDCRLKGLAVCDDVKNN